MTFSRFSQRRSYLLLTIWVVFFAALVSADDLKLERGRMEDILDVVAKDVEKDFYDPKMKGLDWKALTAQAHEQIRKANSVGEMIAAIFGLVNNLQDSHTVFIPPGRTQRVSYGFKARPYGEDIFVYDLQKNGPAVAAGLELGDKIVAVNDFKAERKTWPLMSRYFEVLNPYEYMEVAVVRGSEPLKRIRIRAKTDPRWARIEFNTWTYNDALQEFDKQEAYYGFRRYPDGVGYLKLRTFNIYPDQAGNAAKRLQDARAAVLDLRGNHGGALNAMMHFAGYFTPDTSKMGDMIFRNKSEPIAIKPHRANLPKVLVVMVDSESASAAEMTARHLQLERGAMVIGDNSAGLVNLARIRWESVGAHDRVGFGAEIAVARAVMSNGEELENRGVRPDIVCLPSSDDLRLNRDPCLDKALQKARAMIADRTSPGN